MKHMISYNNLWGTMKRRSISQYRLIHEYNISPGQLNRLRNNEYVTTNTIELLCKILDCSVEEVMQLVENEPEKEK